ncbi:hypothetical protein ANI_1_1896074 [Paecilomyces variotii No. 5]|uniref:Uncharacterized protein n=1 Tax=Byssochlamys spectabilis (strain No. 5 / NBRC 109023) TaxID=1356009 RepID=V5FZA9_BYSSN|nr:hypothetical protein ANI_1_1896074 [Paecilomyces variotii No. 5]
MPSIPDTVGPSTHIGKLIETGRFFRSSGSMQSRTQLKRAIPSAHEQFQNALDSLSEQIVCTCLIQKFIDSSRYKGCLHSRDRIIINAFQFIAKAFLEKDYEALQAKKATPPAPVPAAPVTEPQQAEDVVMKEELVDSGVSTQGPADQTEAQPSEQKKPDEQGEGTAPQATADQQTGKEKDIKNEKQEETGTETGQQFGTGDELNFDSMLPDTGGTGTNEFDLHLDFGNDEIGNQNFLSGTSFLDSEAGNNGRTGQGKDQRGSISSLLPGLESYAANATGEEFNMDLQGSGNNTSQQQGQQQPDTQKDNNNNNQDEMMAPGGSSFDDLFMENDNFGADGDDNLLGGDGLMDIGELDDSWFN